MKAKDHDLVAKIYSHPDFKITGDEQVMYIVYIQAHMKEYPAFNKDPKLVDFRFDREKFLDMIDIAIGILKKGETLNKLNENGFAPIHTAAKEGYLETVKALIEAGAKLNTKNTNGYTPLFNAAVLGRSNIVKALIEGGADVNAKTHDGTTALHFSSSFGYLKIVKDLISAGSDINGKTTSGATPLHNAASYGHVEVVKELLNAGATPNLKDKSGITPLHSATVMGYIEVIKALISGGADIHMQDQFGISPLRYSTSNKNKAVYKLFSELSKNDEKKNLATKRIELEKLQEMYKKAMEHSHSGDYHENSALHNPNSDESQTTSDFI